MASQNHKPLSVEDQRDSILACERTEEEWGRVLDLDSDLLKLPHLTAVTAEVGYYGYLHIDPATHWIMYVGIGHRGRAFDFGAGGRSSEHSSALSRLCTIYSPSQIVRVYPQIGQREARLWEIWAIDKAVCAGHILYNRSMSDKQLRILGSLYRLGWTKTVRRMRSR